MSAMIEEAYEGGAKRPSEGSKDGSEHLAEVVAFIGERVIGHGGRKLPDAASVLALRKEPTREAALRALLLHLCPGGVNPEVWYSWLSGEDSPFKNAKLNRVSLIDKSSGQVMKLSSDRVANAERRMAEAEAKLTSAKIDLENAKAYDSALVQWSVSEHLADLMRPMFSMGPAWTILRALSAYASRDYYAEDLQLVTDPKKRKLADDRLRQQRATETEELLSGLDLWCGDEQFERDLRTAIAGVVQTYKSREPERDREGMRARGKEAMRKSVRPETATARDAILAGLARSPQAD